MFEVEKKLEDYQKEHVMITQAEFERMSYLERVKLCNEHPDQYASLVSRQKAPSPCRSSGHSWSSQIRYDD